MKRIKLHIWALGALALFTIKIQSVEAFESFSVGQCPVDRPLAFWNFNKGDLPTENDMHVEWRGDHGGIQNIPNTTYKGIKFGFRGKGPEGDSSSEWRYKINMPLSNTWEYLKIFQPTNYYHRYFVKIETPTDLSESDWREGDRLVNPWGMTATVGAIKDNYLFIKDFSQRFDKNWGNNLLIENQTTGITVEAIDSRIVGTNNKFSAQWQGKYSNAGMIVEVEAHVPAIGADIGTGYFRPTINTSKAHRGTGTVKNKLRTMPGVAFNPRDNGTIVEFVIERTRSSAKDVRDGSYRLWKRTETTGWLLVHENTGIYAWQPDNFFDHGYVFGWANSGYDEDTNFYLLGWSLWAEKPNFLP